MGADRRDRSRGAGRAPGGGRHRPADRCGDRDRHPTQPDLTGRIEAYEMAFRMQKNATEVFDLSREPKSMHALYGDNQFSKHCLSNNLILI